MWLINAQNGVLWCKQVYVDCSDIMKITNKLVLPVPDFKQELPSAATMGFLLKIRK